MMTDEERAAARKFCDEATAGPWRITAGYQASQEGRYDDDVSVIEAVTEGGAEPIVEHVYYDGHHTIVRPVDAAFIAASRAGWPAALDEVERQSKRADAFKRQLGCCADGLHAAMDDVDRLRERLAAPAEILNALKLWVAERREAETADRPDVNIYKRVLLATWNQVEAKIDELLARRQAEVLLAEMCVDPPEAGP